MLNCIHRGKKLDNRVTACEMLTGGIFGGCRIGIGGERFEIKKVVF